MENNFIHEYITSFSVSPVENLDSVTGILTINFGCFKSGAAALKETYYDTTDHDLFNAGFYVRLTVSGDENSKILSSLDFIHEPGGDHNHFYSRETSRIISLIKGKAFDKKAITDFMIEKFGYFPRGQISEWSSVSIMREKLVFKFNNNDFFFIVDIYNDSGEAKIELISVVKPDKIDPEIGKITGILTKKLKFEQIRGGGFRYLFDRLGFIPDKMKKPEPGKDEIVNVYFNSVFNYYFHIYLKNETGSAAGFSSKYIHDMRVAARRCRTLIKAFRMTMLSRIHLRLKNNFKWIAVTLGNVRDWDVYIEKLEEYVPAGLAGHAELMKYILKEIEIFRGTELGKLRRMFLSARYIEFIDFIKDLKPEDFTRRDAKSVSGLPIDRMALNTLFSFMKKVEKAGLVIIKTGLDNYSDAMIHGVRILLKNLRYLMEIFSPIIEPEGIKDLMVVLPRIQDIFGNYIDTIFLLHFTGSVMKSMQKSPAYRVLFAARKAIFEKKKTLRELAINSIRDLLEAEEWETMRVWLERKIIES